MGIDQLEPGRRPLRHYAEKTTIAKTGVLIAGVGLAGFAAGSLISESNRPDPVFDCSVGREGVVEIDIPKGGEYSIKSINGSSAVLRESRSGEIVVFIKDSDGKSVTLQVPTRIEDENAIYNIDKALIGKKNLVVVSGTCKQEPSLSPNTPKPTK